MNSSIRGSYRDSKRVSDWRGAGLHEEKNSCKADKDKALRIAKELGLDIDQLQKDAEDSDIKKALDEAKDLAQKLSLKGTPLFLVGDRVISGAPDDLFDQLEAKVAEVRQNGCAGSC